MRKRLFVLGALVVALLAVDALAQPPQQRRPGQPGQAQQKGRPGQPGQGFGIGFGGGSRDLVSLASQKSVQEDLKLTEDQVKKVAALAEAGRGTGRPTAGGDRTELQKKMAERTAANEKALSLILKPEQFKRAKQISWQQQGASALASADVAAALQLSAEQQDKIKGLQEEAQKARGQGFQRGTATGAGNFEEIRKKMEEARKASDEKILGVLSTEQKTKWKELTGEPFKGEIQRRRPGGQPPR